MKVFSVEFDFLQEFFCCKNSIKPGSKNSCLIYLDINAREVNKRLIMLAFKVITHSPNYVHYKMKNHCHHKSFDQKNKIIKSLFLTTN